MAAGSETSLAPALPSRLIERNFSFVGSRSRFWTILTNRGAAADVFGTCAATEATTERPRCWRRFRLSVALPPVIVIALIVPQSFLL